MTKKKLYLLIFILITGMVPWFTFGENASPDGVPVWVLYTFGVTFMFAGIVAWLLKKYWDTSAENGWDST